MLKHSFHARLSLWHIALLVAVLTLALPLLENLQAPPPVQQSQAGDMTLPHTKS